VQNGVYDGFTKRLAETAGAMKVTDGFEQGAVIGPLIDMKAVEKVEAHIADAVKKGARVVTGGKRSALGGIFFEATVLTDVTTDMVITKEETFGPVAPLPVQDRRRNHQDGQRHPHPSLPRSRGRVREGVATYFYSRGIGRIWRVAVGLEIRHRGIPRGQIPLHGRHRPLNSKSTAPNAINGGGVYVGAPHAPHRRGLRWNRGFCWSSISTAPSSIAFRTCTLR
jgi:succinate-semialdehyde dehydrogenase / glutarate-semialdehyde dehydrogenase